MARPTKNTVDYFPHIIQNGKTIFILESKYGNDGYAFWFKLLELLGASNNHYYDYNNPPDWQFLLAKTKVCEEIALNILETLAELGAVDKQLLKKKVIWSDNFIENVADVYKRRTQEIPQKPVISSNKPVNDNNNPPNDDIKPQSIVKETKVNNKEQQETADKLLKQINNEGDINIYKLLGRLKKEMKAKEDFPAEIIIGVCNRYLKDKANINSPWPWLVKVFKIECNQYYAGMSRQEGEKQKDQPVPKLIKDVLKTMGGER